MTDHIPADKLQEFIDEWEQLSVTEGADEVLDDLRRLLPTPTPRTLADMTENERKACQWSLVETPENEGVFIKQHGNKALVIYPNGRHIFWGLNEVVPMLDLPRLEWPASEPVAEDTPEPERPQPEDVKPEPQPGEAWLIEYEGRRYQAVYWHSPIYAHWTFLYDWERGPSTVESAEATPVSRLVPERGDVS